MALEHAERMRRDLEKESAGDDVRGGQLGSDMRDGLGWPDMCAGLSGADMRDDLASLDEAAVDVNLPGPLRIRRYLEQIRNPYCFLCGTTRVSLSFVNEEREFPQALREYLNALREGM